MDFKLPEPNGSTPFPNLHGSPDPYRFSSFSLKGNARRVLSSDWQNTLSTTGIYLLVTLWARNLFQLFFPTPINTALTTLTEGLERLQNQAETLSEQAFIDLYGSVLGSAWGALQEGLSTASGMITTFLLILLFLVGLIADYGYQSWSLRRIRGDFAGPEELASRVYLAGSIILLTGLVMVTVGLWFWLLLFPALYFWYRLRMCSYLLLDYPDITVWQAYSYSSVILSGYKWKLFLLDLSFLGWYLLADVAGALPGLFFDNGLAVNLLSLVLISAVYLYTQPYRALSYARFYVELKESSPAFPVLEKLMEERKKARENRE